MTEDFKNYELRKHDLQGLTLGFIGVVGLMLLITL